MLSWYNLISSVMICIYVHWYLEEISISHPVEGTTPAVTPAVNHNSPSEEIWYDFFHKIINNSFIIVDFHIILKKLQMLAHYSKFEAWFVNVKMLAHRYLFRSSLILLRVSSLHANIICGTCCHTAELALGIPCHGDLPSFFMDGWVIELLASCHYIYTIPNCSSK